MPDQATKAANNRRRFIVRSSLKNASLQGARSSFTGADTHRLPELRNEYLTVADLTRARRLNDGFHDPVHLLVVHRQLELHFRQEVDDVFSSSIQLSVAFLPAKAFDLCHGNALHPHIGQGGADIVQFEWFDDGDDQFHAGELLNSSNDKSSSGIGAKLLRYSIEYCANLLYKPWGVLRRARD